jgi:hypothetical protein
MMSGHEVTLEQPARFRARGTVHILKDGVPFYVFAHNGKGQGTFTLPAGTYTVNGGHLIGRMKKRKGHRTTNAPRFPIPGKVRLVFAPNPNKCSISLPDGIIIADTSLRNAPAFVLVFILFHEIGHYFYQDEAECDRFAAEEMFRRGYNPSQIAIATELSMNDPHRRSENIKTAQGLKP